MYEQSEATHTRKRVIPRPAEIKIISRIEWVQKQIYLIFQVS
jgi:hypothetical protein